VKPGDVVVVRKGAVTYTYKVLALIDKRQGAKLVPQYAENLTPQEELDKLHAPVETFFLKRDRGTGRPTKKDRRQMDELWDSLDF
jgi:ribosome-associated heat shock protein Hsp15